MFKLKRKLLISKLFLCFIVATVNCDDAKKKPKITPETYVDDGKQLLQFSCEADLEKGDKLTWSITRANKKEEKLTSYEEGEKTKSKKLDLSHPLKEEDNNAEIVCIAEHKGGTKVLSKKVPIVFKSKAKSDDAKKKPKITPETYVDDGKQLLQFSCEADLEKGDKLTWSITRANKKEEILTSYVLVTLLGEKTMSKKLDLSHPLKEEDNKSEIVCIAEHKGGTKILSKKVPIVFKSKAESDKAKEKPKITPETYVDDGNRLLQVSCEADLEKGEKLTWIITRNGKEETLKSLTADGKSTSYKLDLNHWLKRTDNNTDVVCIADKSGTKTPSKKVHIVFQRSYKFNTNPIITPEKYVDDGKPFLEFYCEAYLEEGDKLSWSITRNTTEETIVLYEELDESIPKILELHYPLAVEDNNAVIVCIKERREPKNKTLSEKVPIVFIKAKVPEKREKVFVWPQKSILVYNNTTPLPLACWGYLDATDKAKDTNLYVTWYQIYGSTRPERITMLPQENKRGYVKLEMMKIFTPIIDDESRIYCATEKMSTTFVTTPQVESEKMTLLFFPPADVCYPLDECKIVSALGWAVAVVLAVLAMLTLVGLLAAIFSLCCRGDRECEANSTQESTNK